MDVVSYRRGSGKVMVGGIGLCVYVGWVGVDGGGELFERVMGGEGGLWVGMGLVIRFIGVVMMGLVWVGVWKMELGNRWGMVWGSMGKGMGVKYENEIIGGDEGWVR